MQQTDQSGNLITEFKCKICGTTVRFNVDDSSTYESKTPHENYFGMQLTTVRVSHDTDHERHHNAIVVDQKGLFRGYRDAYSEPLLQTSHESHSALIVHPSQEDQLLEESQIELLIVVDRKRFWVQTYLCSEEFKPTELARLVMERVDEAERIYDAPSKQLTFAIADMNMHIWRSKERIVFASVKASSIFPAIDALADGLLHSIDNLGFNNKRAVEVAVRVIRDVPDIDPKVIYRLVTDSMIFTVASTPFQERINSIVERVSKRFPIAKVILRPLLSGTSSLIDLLEDGYWKDVSAAFEMVDFINKRGLLG